MWHNDEIMTSLKDSVMTKEEFEKKEALKVALNHEPPFHPYYQSDQLWEDREEDVAASLRDRTLKESLAALARDNSHEKVQKKIDTMKEAFPHYYQAAMEEGKRWLIAIVRLPWIKSPLNKPRKGR